MKVTIETIGGRRYKPVSHDKKGLYNAIRNAIANINNPAPIQAQSAADELAKLVVLRDKGIISSVEFEAQKKKLLS